MIMSLLLTIIEKMYYKKHNLKQWLVMRRRNRYTQYWSIFNWFERHFSMGFVPFGICQSLERITSDADLCIVSILLLDIPQVTARALLDSTCYDISGLCHHWQDLVSKLGGYLKSEESNCIVSATCIHCNECVVMTFIRISCNLLGKSIPNKLDPISHCHFTNHCIRYPPAIVCCLY